MGSNIHALDITCLPVGGNAAQDGCPAHIHVMPPTSDCIGRVAFDLFGPLLPEPNLPGTTQHLGAVISHLSIDFWLQPALFEEFACDLPNVAQPVYFRWALVKKSANTDLKFFNQFADGQTDEVMHTVLRRGHHTWWPKSTTQVMLTDVGFPGNDPCESTLGGGAGPSFPASDQTGTIIGAAAALFSVEEDRPFHLKTMVKRRLVVKETESITLLLEWGNPFLNCACDAMHPDSCVNWSTDIWGRAECHQTLGV
jgi:hypothetical protein